MVKVILAALIAALAGSSVAYAATNGSRVYSNSDYYVDTFEHNGNRCYVAFKQDGSALFTKATAVGLSVSCVKK